MKYECGCCCTVPCIALCVATTGVGNKEDQPLPIKVNVPGHAVSCSAGGNASCCLTKTGKLFTWGSNNRGQLGLGTTSDQVVYPSQVYASHE